MFVEEMAFDNDGSLVCYHDKTEHYHRVGYIPAKHVFIIWQNLQLGCFYHNCSPMYDVTRKQVAYILAHFHPNMYKW